MALYEGVITIPPRTSADNPVEIIVRPLTSFIKNVSILFPGGSLGLVGVKISEDNRQFAPMSSGWIRDNDKTVTFQVNRNMQGPPYRILIHGFSLASDWPHTVIVRLEVT